MGCTILPRATSAVTSCGVFGRLAAESSRAPIPELAGPREENLASLARLVADRRGGKVRIEEVKGGGLGRRRCRQWFAASGTAATLAGPTFEEWLATQPDSGITAQAS